MIDIQQCLSDSNIKYRTKGKNVTSGWVEIHCPFDDCNDESFHMGISKTGVYHCWICGRKGLFSHLLSVIDHSSEKSARAKLRRYDDDIYKEDDPIKNSKVLWLPDEIQKVWPKGHLDYLEGRGYDPDKLIKKYSLMPVANFGVYRYRIIIPIFVNRRMVSWQAADVLRTKDRIKYLACPPEKSIMSLNHTLYNIDTVEDTVVWVEGVTGVWRIGDGCVAAFTKNFTKEQVLLLTQKNIKKAFVMLDPDARKKSKELASILSGVISHVEEILLHEGDPGDMTRDEVMHLRRDIFK